MSKSFPWGGAALLAVPAFGMAFGAGVAGIDGPIGIGLSVAAVAYLGVSLLVLQPRLERRAGLAGGPDAAGLAFLDRALSAVDVDEVARELGRAVSAATGQVRTLLLVPGADGASRVLQTMGEGAGTALEIDLDDPTVAFMWLGDRAEPVFRADLDDLLGFEGARATAGLLDVLECNAALPLRHRGLLLGLVLIRMPARVSDELVRFFASLRAYTTVAVANTFLGAEARGRTHLSETFDLANAMQEALMPDERPVRRRAYELRGLFRPVAECGGDLWAWRQLAGGQVCLMIADATGHGAAPALLAAVAKGTLDAHWQMSLDDLDPAELLTVLNRAIHRAGRKRYMMTAFAAVVDVERGRVRYANAGQNFPFVLGASGLELLIARGNSLGATAEASYEVHQRDLRPGDRLILYTDGLTEAGSPLVEPFGEKRLRAAITAMGNERAARIPELLLAEVEQFLDGVAWSDDITILAFEYLEGS